MPRTVCLVSGGLDSCVAAAIAQQRGNELFFLHVSYGQLTSQREKRAFSEIADYYEVDSRLVVELAHLSSIGGSALTDSCIPVPAGDLSSQDVPVSYVPFRNGNLLSCAISWAEVIRADSVFLGAVQEDSSGYPDCREVFFHAFEEVVRLGTKPETNIAIEVPLIHLSKKDIVLLGLELDAPLQLTWSCYQNEETACGRCDSCLLRLRAFEEAGVTDTVPYCTH
jgi:7-cyano-7-deazaguanine synthase